MTQPPNNSRQHLGAWRDALDRMGEKEHTDRDTTRLITGNAIVLELQPCPWMLRLLAGCIDAALVLVLLIGLFVSLGVWSPEIDAAYLQIGTTLAVIAVTVGYPVTMETLTRGKTLGKMATGTRVYRSDGGPIIFRHAFARGILGLFEKLLTLGGLALLVCIVSPRGQRLGDMTAGTIVVRERIKPEPPRQHFAPPHLQAWVQAADIRPLPADIAIAMVQFVSRGHKLHPESRAVISQSLGAQLSTYVSPAPPAWATPEDVCQALVAERQRRDVIDLNVTKARRDARRAFGASPL